ncbi:FtsW/RodA/SpoVE family cell cycle protein [Bacillus sp. ISL-35]|uniref:FtsW/RodA/SpoVE family cell cycle protein n=1 Tax=Bacillus sp. ISL-35 TaxID=2819122 RepID=UPI001BED3599|nr:FtsW/RodA/SpoVE family cell cycle protein [Bacillus sp. ISL-35]MBT2706086.1 FtsW/RodA/SpoVE family cell cycle protein [Chryseobacterium sp. ISL-80]
MSKRWDHFLSEVMNHIRSKEAKKFVASELEYHLNEVKKEWNGKGMSETEAEEKAVSQMGSPSKLGHEMNKLHKPKVDWLLIGLLVITMGLSFLPLITAGDGLENDYIARKSIHVLLGILLAVVMMFIDYRKFENKGYLFYSLGVLLLVALITIPNLYINGVPYLMVGPFQVSSFMALPFLFLAWASFFSNEKIKLWQHFLLFGVALLLFVAIPNLSVTFLYVTMVFAMMWWSTIKRKTAIILTIIAGLAFIFFGTLAWFTVKEYQLARLLGFLHPEKYPDNWGYMYLQLRGRLDSAGWFGSAAESKALPFEHTDYAFLNLMYHYGYWFAIMLFVILSLFAVRILMISKSINSKYGNLLLFGGLTLFLVQFIYNVGMILGVFPLISMSLPFISYGLLHMLFNAFIMGMVLSVFRRKDITLKRA